MHPNTALVLQFYEARASDRQQAKGERGEAYPDMTFGRTLSQVGREGVSGRRRR